MSTVTIEPKTLSILWNHDSPIQTYIVGEISAIRHDGAAYVPTMNSWVMPVRIVPWVMGEQYRMQLDTLVKTFYDERKALHDKFAARANSIISGEALA